MPTSWWNSGNPRSRITRIIPASSILMDRITELRPDYTVAEWLEEYTPYRLASALGRWDAEYNIGETFRVQR